MEFWLIEDGKKTGPFQSYEVRDRIERGELGPETKGWHRDQEDWRPLGEMEVFRSEFEGPPEPAPVPVAPPPLPSPAAGWAGVLTRFLARWMDLQLYQLLVFGGMRLLDINILVAVQSPWFNISYLFPFLILEGIALSRWKAPPGKLLGGIVVENREGGALSLTSGLARACRVFIMGVGLLLPIVRELCQAFGLWFVLKKKFAPWDWLERNVVRIPSLRPERVILLALVVIGLYAGKTAVLISAMLETPEHLPEPYREQIEDFKEALEKMRKPGDGGA